MVPDTRVAKRILSDDLLRMANGIEIEADRLLEELNDQNLYHPVLKKIENDRCPGANDSKAYGKNCLKTTLSK